MGEATKRWEEAAYLPLAVTLWLVSTLFLGGDLGKYADDYFFGGRDPVTAEPFGAVSLAERPFRRPLTWLLVTNLHRHLWFHDAALHVLSALGHGLVAVLLWRLLRSLELSLGACVAAALLFLVYPAHYEVVLWSSALATGIAAATFLCICQLTVRHAQRHRAGGTLLAIGALSFVLPCWNEQPAAGVAALPLLHLAVAPERPPRRRFGRALSAGLAASAGVLLYGVLFWSTARPGMRGTPSTMPGTGALAAEAGRIAREAVAMISLRDLGASALAEGLRTLLAWPWSSTGLLAALLLSTWIALRRGTPEPAGDVQRALRAPLRRSLLLGFALAVFVLDWVPLLAAHGMRLSSRLLYAPALALAMAFAVALDALASGPVGAPARAPARRWIAAAVLSLPLALGSVAMVGIQDGYRARARTDAAVLGSLRRALPDPPPGTLILVVDDANARAPGVARAMGLLSPLAFPQAATVFVRWGYRRNDLFATQLIPGLVSVAPAGADAVEISGLDPAFPVDGAATHARGSVVLPRSRIVPVRISANANVVLADRAEVAASGGGDPADVDRKR